MILAGLRSIRRLGSNDTPNNHDAFVGTWNCHTIAEKDERSSILVAVVVLVGGIIENTMVLIVVRARILLVLVLVM